jgi:thioredoxin 2
MNTTFSVCNACGGVNRVTRDKAMKGEAICGKCQAKLPMRSLVSEVDSKGLQKILRNAEGPVIVDFWASWCGPCKMYGPEFEKASLTNKNAIFLKINTETEQMISSQMGIRGIPCTIIFKDGKEVKRQAGALSAQGVEELLNSV